MGAFEYQALDPRGRTVRGVSAGDSARQVRQELRDQGLTPLAVVGVSEEVKQGQASRRVHRTRIKINELAVITRQFATLLGSGLTVEDSLYALIKQAEGHGVKTVLSGIRAQVVEGRSLAEAIASYPRSFPEIFQASVAAGEQSGNLDVVLDRLANYVEARQGLQQRIGVALIYPAILTVVAVLIVVGLLTYVVPKVVKVFEDSGQELPWLTRALIGLSERQPQVRYALHGAYLRMPGIRRLTRGVNSARMARTLAILAGSGVPLLSAMRSCEGVIGNLVLRGNLRDAAAEVTEGVSINKALARSGNFPPLLVQMVASGETSGRLDEMLDKAATALERELESRIAVLVGLFEPVMILLMGGLVLVIVLAILLPIFDLNQLIG
jgi:general secretion pathway protein F